MKKITLGQKIFNVFNIIIITLLCVVMVYPYLNQVAIAFNEGVDTSFGGITLWPRVPTLDNFRELFSNNKIYMAMLVSVTRTILNVVLALLVTYSAAYALTRKTLRGRSFITRILCLPMYVHAGTIPMYILYRYLGLINNYWVYVLPYMFSFYNMIIIRSFLQDIPESLEESALLDGANEIQILFRIMLPLSKPVLATVALWIAVGQWNDYTTTLMYITDEGLFTLQYFMLRVLKQGEVMAKMMAESAVSGTEVVRTTTSESVQAAILIVATVPIICVYPFLQKHFVKGVTLGAVKG